MDITKERIEELEECMEWFEDMVTFLVDDPEVLTIHKEIVNHDFIRVKVVGPRDDMGKLFGKNKTNEAAIRQLLSSVAYNHNFAYMLWMGTPERERVYRVA